MITADQAVARLLHVTERSRKKHHSSEADRTEYLSDLCRWQVQQYHTGSPKHRQIVLDRLSQALTTRQHRRCSSVESSAFHVATLTNAVAFQQFQLLVVEKHAFYCHTSILGIRLAYQHSEEITVCELLGSPGVNAGQRRKQEGTPAIISLRRASGIPADQKVTMRSHI